MADQTPVLALDIGNTRAHVGIIDTERQTCLASTAFPVGEIEQRLLPAIEALINEASTSLGKTVAIAGVVQQVVSTTEKLLLRNGYSVNQLTSSSPLPFTLRYDTPQTLGADRLANALYAVTVHPGTPVVCISAGTAIVIDYIADNTFFGGAILPGIRLQLSSLHRGTAALPDFGGNVQVEIPSLPGTTTERCIVGGVIRGAAAAISGIVAGYVDQPPGQQPIILATGGDWPLLAPLVEFDHFELPELTLIGIAILPACH